MPRNDEDPLWEDFHSVVNMSSRSLREWLASDAAAEQSPATEDAEQDPEQATPPPGPRVLEVLSKRRGDLDDADRAVMQDVVDFVRSLEPDPDAPPIDDESTRRRLMSVGHDVFLSGKDTDGGGR